MLRLNHYSRELTSYKNMVARGDYISKFQQNISCPVCGEVYDQKGRTPKSLPCSHTVCVACLDAFMKKEKCSRCPICKANFPVPEGGLKCLPTNKAMTAMLDLLPPEIKEEPKRRETADIEIRRPLCSKHNNAECFSYCVECRVPLCNTCSATDKAHSKHYVTHIDKVMYKDKIENSKVLIARLVRDHEAFIKQRKATIEDYKKRVKYLVSKALEASKEKILSDIDGLYNTSMQKLNSYDREFKTRKAEVDYDLKDFSRSHCDQRKLVKTMKTKVDNLVSLATRKDSLVTHAELENIPTKLKIEKPKLDITREMIRDARVNLSASSSASSVSRPQLSAASSISSFTRDLFRIPRTPKRTPQTTPQLSAASSVSSNLETLVMLTDLGTGSPGSVCMNLMLNDIGTFERHILGTSLNSQTWYIMNIPWRIEASLNTYQGKEKKYKEKSKPVLYVAVTCGKKARGEWSFKSTWDICIYNYEKRQFEKHREMTNKFSNKDCRWITDVNSWDFFKDPANGYVKNNTLMITVKLTLL